MWGLAQCQLVQRNLFPLKSCIRYLRCILFLQKIKDQNPNMHCLLCNVHIEGWKKQEEKTINQVLQNKEANNTVSFSSFRYWTTPVSCTDLSSNVQYQQSQTYCIIKHIHCWGIALCLHHWFPTKSWKYFTDIKKAEKETNFTSRQQFYKQTGRFWWVNNCSVQKSSS